MKIPADARMTEPYWHRKGEAGRYTFDADAPFGLPMRPTPFYVQVSLTLPGGGEVVERSAGRSSATGQHLQRREADRAAGGAGAVGSRVAADRDRSRIGDPIDADRAGASGDDGAIGRPW